MFRPAIFCVSETDWNPEYVLTATGHSTEWVMTKTMLLSPSPNQSMAIGNSAIVRVQDAVNRRTSQLDVLQRSGPEVRGDLRPTGHERRECVGMRHVHRNRI